MVQHFALRPLIDFVEPVDTPLYNFLELDELSSGNNPIENILVSNAWTDLSDDNFLIGADFYLGIDVSVHPYLIIPVPEAGAYR